MRRVKIELWDDLHWAEDKRLTAAALTITVGLNGAWAELDVSEANHTLIRNVLDPWMKAGHEPDSQPAPPPRKTGRPPGTHREIPRESLEWGRTIREFARKQDIPYQTRTGKYYYSVRLRKAYEEYLEKKPEGER